MKNKPKMLDFKPAFQLFASDEYMDQKKGLLTSAAQWGAWIRIRLYMWAQKPQGQCIYNETLLKHVALWSDTDEGAWAKVIGLFKKKKNFLIDEDAQKQIAKMNRASKTKAKNAKDGWEKRRQKRQEDDSTTLPAPVRDLKPETQTVAEFVFYRRHLEYWRDVLRDKIQSAETDLDLLQPSLRTSRQPKLTFACELLRAIDTALRKPEDAGNKKPTQLDYDGQKVWPNDLATEFREMPLWEFFEKIAEVKAFQRIKKFFAQCLDTSVRRQDELAKRSNETKVFRGQENSAEKGGSQPEEKTPPSVTYRPDEIIDFDKKIPELRKQLDHIVSPGHGRRSLFWNGKILTADAKKDIQNLKTEVRGSLDQAQAFAKFTAGTELTQMGEQLQQMLDDSDKAAQEQRQRRKQAKRGAGEEVAA